MKIATAAYPLDWFADFAAYEAKLTAWITEAAEAGAQLAVFPEYGAMELASVGGDGVIGDDQAAIRVVDSKMADANALHRDLARKTGLHILGASASVIDGGSIVNRSHFHTPQGETAFQDKLVMTLWERAPMGCTGQGPLKLFDTALGLIAINICYDSEFPLLARSQSAADLLLIPSTTEKEEGYWRVRIAARARALESQCVTVMSSTVGPYPNLPLMETSWGAGGVFCPPDRGLPPTGILAAGAANAPGWTFAEVDLAAVRALRTGGNVRTHRDWAEWEDRLGPPERIDLR